MENGGHCPLLPRNLSVAAGFPKFEAQGFGLPLTEVAPPGFRAAAAGSDGGGRRLSPFAPGRGRGAVLRCFRRPEGRLWEQPNVMHSGVYGLLPPSSYSSGIFQGCLGTAKALQDS